MKPPHLRWAFYRLELSPIGLRLIDVPFGVGRRLSSGPLYPTTLPFYFSLDKIMNMLYNIRCCTVSKSRDCKFISTDKPRLGRQHAGDENMSVTRTVDQPFPVSFVSEGSNLKGWFYPATGIGPYPTVILLHGYPGKDGDALGLGERMMKEGINALAFNYRGTWGSEGLFTHQTALADVSSAIAYLKTSSLTQKQAVDANRIAVAGYSWGGGMALLGSLGDPSVRKVAYIGGTNLGEFARQIRGNEELRKAHEQFLDETMSESGVAHGLGGKASHVLLFETIDDFDLVKHAEVLASKDILLIWGWRDTDYYSTLESHVLPLFRALQKCGAERLSIGVFDTDHSFAGVEEELAKRIASWIKN